VPLRLPWIITKETVEGRKNPIVSETGENGSWNDFILP
jgi:hypothetical protein